MMHVCYFKVTYYSTCNTTEDELGLVISAHTSSKGTIVYCNCTFEGGDGGYDSDECSDDGESRGGRPAESPTCTPLFIEGRIFKKGNLGTKALTDQIRSDLELQSDLICLVKACI